MRGSKTQIATLYNFDFPAVTISTIFSDHKLHARCECFGVKMADPDQTE